MTAETESVSSPMPLQLAIVGCVAAHLHYQQAFAALDTVQIVAVADSDLSVAKAWARLIGKLPFFSSLSELLKAHPAVDAVLVSSPLPERTRDIRTALEAGKSVLSDAPFTLTLKECDTLCDLADVHEALLMPAFPRRFDPYFAEFGTHLTKTEPLPQIRCERTFTLENPELITKEATFAARSQTLMQTAASHAIDICLHWLGEAQTLSADVILPDETTPTRGRMPQETLVTLLIGQESGQSVVRLTSTRALQTAERCTYISREGTLELVASPGTSAATDTPPALFLTHANQRSTELTPNHVSIERETALLAHFADCLQNKATPQLTCADARAALEILTAATISAREGSKITLPLRVF